MGGLIKESEIVNNTFSTKYINLSTSVSVEDIGKQGIAKWWRYLGIIFRTFIYGLFWRPQLVYITLTSHGMGLWKDAVIVAICRLLRLKHVFHFHNKGVVHYAAANKKADRLYRFVFKKAHVILLSPLLYEDIAAYVSKENVSFCANGIPAMGSKINKASKFPNAPLQVLFLSNLITTKGIWELLAACQLLREQAISFHCNIVGGEGDVTAQALEKQIQDRGLQECVSYLGKKYGEQKAAVFEEADVFIHPTYEDCFPLVLLEAMQFGLPIISTPEGAIPEIVKEGETGFIVPKKDAAALADKITFLQQNPSRLKEIGESAKEKFQQEYTLHQFEQRMVEILKQLVEDKKIVNDAI